MIQEQPVRFRYLENDEGVKKLQYSFSMNQMGVSLNQFKPDTYCHSPHMTWSAWFDLPLDQIAVVKEGHAPVTAVDKPIPQKGEYWYVKRPCHFSGSIVAEVKIISDITAVVKFSQPITNDLLQGPFTERLYKTSDIEFIEKIELPSKAV